jgi:hypothetical protein
MGKLTIEIIASRVHGILAERAEFREQAPAKLSQIKAMLGELAKAGHGLVRAHRIQFQTIPSGGALTGDEEIFKEAPYVEFTANHQTFKIVASRGVTIVVAPSEEDRSRGSTVRNTVRTTSSHELFEMDEARVQQIVLEHLWECAKRELGMDDSEVARAELLAQQRAEDRAAAARELAAENAAKLDAERRSLAGIGSPLYEAVVARFDGAVVAELEAEALARLAARSSAHSVAGR